MKLPHLVLRSMPRLFKACMVRHVGYTLLHHDAASGAQANAALDPVGGAADGLSQLRFEDGFELEDRSGAASERELPPWACS